MQKYRHIVQYYETDKMGITHHSNYIRWMEEARIDFLRQIGWDYAKLESIGIISPVTAVNCKYKKSTTFGDVIDIDVIVEEFKEVKLKLQYTMTNEQGEIVEYNVYQAVLIVRCSADEKLYLYDIQNIKKETRYPSWIGKSDGQKPVSSININ